MKIQKITIKNFRCFKGKTIEFNIPDGSNNGSGLNIFIGENTTGKTTVLESIDYLTQSRLKTKGLLKINDFNEISTKIEIIAETDIPFEVKRAFGKNTFDCSGFYFWAKIRERNESTSLIDPIVFDYEVIKDASDTTNIYDVEKRIEVRTPYTGRLPKFKIAYFDKNRSRHKEIGSMFPTKLDSILDDFNTQLILKLQDSAEEEKKKLLSLNDNARETIIPLISDKVVIEIISEFNQYLDVSIKLDLVSILEPFSKAFFTYRKDDSAIQIPLSKMGSGVEMLFALFVLYKITEKFNETIIFLIDEPELHLHPQWQIKLVSLLMEISKNHQVFVSTHSPYIYRNCMTDEVALLLFRKNENSEIEIINARDSGFGLFEWSPSWGEINYFAFNLPTVEFHNELYGYLQEKTENYRESEIENYFSGENHLLKAKKWIPEKDGEVQAEKDVTLQTFIRNKIHHPENVTMQNEDYSQDELKKSIEEMIYLVRRLK